MSKALEAVRMVLDAATEDGHELSASEICDAINWDMLREVASEPVPHTHYVIQDGSECNYKLTMPEHERIWLKLKGADIGIMHNSEGVMIDVYKNEADDDFPQDSLSFLWSDYEDDEEDE
ncbi:MAG: hypothetical protein CME17_05050 [Gemmatimonadetes bacterium]|nr:hypothetical protein [Gemmatimonadota bacterium]|tara:strand:- start:2582 stop:2941 length:360 start_codon:yes stop_codon:yes gene_type:complete